MVDSGTGNLRSVRNAFLRIGAEVTVVTHGEELARADGIILPGVGAYAMGMAGLRDRGLVEVLRRRAGEEGVPLIGICLGMQMLADFGEEHGMHDGLGLIEGSVIRLQPTEAGYRVPNIGWCDTVPTRKSVLFPDSEDIKAFYFVHSYHMKCTDAGDVAATIGYSGQQITATVERRNIFGVQFHPEKSQDCGLDLLHNFLTYVRGAAVTTYAD